MVFTPLHQALGRQPGPLVVEMLAEAVEVGVAESDQLDWKARLPAEKDLAGSDVVKDLAAFANSGGGMLVFGVTEKEKKATGLVDVGEVTESFERTLRRAAVKCVHPPLFGLDVTRLGDKGHRALAVVVPPSAEVPHLIYRNDYFGAPVRNHADTEWMSERQLEAHYRTRFDQRRNSDRALDDLYEELAAGRDTNARAWLVIVAQPRIPIVGRDLDVSRMRTIAAAATRQALEWVPNTAGVHPLDSVDQQNPRRGLRRWVLVNTPTESKRWREAWIGVHDSGAVSLAHAIGGHKIPSGEQLRGNQIRSRHLECSVADFMALLLQVTTAREVTSEYDLVL
ncbi:MAG: AlbA family DNA-binding domain-containing protein, partial [Nocardioides sp.]